MSTYFINRITIFINRITIDHGLIERNSYLNTIATIKYFDF